MTWHMALENTTRELIERARAGDRGAFDEIVRRSRKPLELFVASRLGPALKAKVEIEDVVQETLLKAFRSLSSFAWHGEGSFVRWISGIAQHIILQLARKELGGEQMGLQLDVVADAVSPSRNLRRGERLVRLEDALRTLSPDHREVILLTRIQGLPVDEVSKRMNRSAKATRQLLFRALESLKKSFGDTESLSLPQRPIDPELRHDRE